MPLFLIINHSNSEFKSLLENSMALLSLKKPSTLSGFEHGIYVPLADAMTTAPRRQRVVLKSSSS
jgi:hypothetical protein